MRNQRKACTRIEGCKETEKRVVSLSRLNERKTGKRRRASQLVGRAFSAHTYSANVAAAVPKTEPFLPAALGLQDSATEQCMHSLTYKCTSPPTFLLFGFLQNPLFKPKIKVKTQTCFEI